MSEIQMINHYIKCVSKCMYECKSDTPEIDCKKKCPLKYESSKDLTN